MNGMLRGKLTYANVMATVALFVALGGGAYAVTHLSKNSVGTKQLKNGAVTKKKISNSAQAALKGQQGAPGQDGTSGAAIAARPSGTTAVVTTAVGANFPLSDATWTQAAGEVDMILGTATILSSPPDGLGAGQCQTNTNQGLTIKLLVNGQNVGQEAFARAGLPSNFVLKVPSFTNGAFYANELPFVTPPTSSQTNTLTAVVSDNCAAGADYTISAMNLQVIRFV